ncbi:S8 family serine peptidase [Streptomyces sp. V4-01]|uniref:S8 family serine peptidase n=1 Tax=Actinacidiphila polyblastidii TaxID=3110430 RepID=A0ABU7P9D7_9ACTN|nr:S8 family serine peptidase [Streptomyces sp. V4-01]
MRRLARGLTAAALLLAPMSAVPGASAATPSPRTDLAPLYRSDRAVTGQYIITLDKTLDPAKFAGTVGVSPLFAYGRVLRGFASVLSTAQLDAVRRTPGVAAVEENATITASDTTASAAEAPAGTAAVPGTTTAHRTQGGPGGLGRAAAASWGLDRIDQHNLPLDHAFTTAGTGQGGTAYILDTGIDFKHAEFGGRAVPGYDAIGDGRNGQDCEGHGTHVAGTVGGATYGVARQARLVSVRVLDCSGRGTLAGIIAGLDWVAQNAQQPAVANASLGGSYSPALNAAADALSDAGVLPVVAAGNDTQDACRVSPAGADRVLTVGATDTTDHETDFSNYGKCVSVFAPGKGIVSAKLGGGSVALDGTSMASPHAAGVALLYKAANPGADAAAVAGWVDDHSTKDVLAVTGDSPNRLLFTDGL